MKRFVRSSRYSRSRRADHHDYRGGAYFVTTNTRKRVPFFGTVERGWSSLNAFGKIVAEEWTRTGELRDEVSLDTFVVMPDHVHGLLWICHTNDEAKPKDSYPDSRETEHDARKSRKENREVHPQGKEGREARLATSSELPPGLEKPEPGTLSTVIGGFKSAVTRRINETRETPGETIWQSSFHDHIVRNRAELRRIRHYIRTNPQRRHND